MSVQEVAIKNKQEYIQQQGQDSEPEKSCLREEKQHFKTWKLKSINEKIQSLNENVLMNH